MTHECEVKYKCPAPILDEAMLPPDIKDDASGNNEIPKTFLKAVMFSLSSISMILLNKAVVTMFPWNSVILILQNLVTIMLLKFQHSNLGFDAQTAWKWTPCVLFFCTNIYSSLQSLIYISVPTFTVFRNVQPLISSVLDLLMRHEPISVQSVIFLGIILCGAYLYAHNDIEYNFYGYMWSFIHIVSMSFYSVCVKLSFEKLKLKPFEMSWYNNILSLCILVPLTWYKVHSDTKLNQLQHAVATCPTNWMCMGTLSASCVGGFFVSVTGFKAQEVLSPTSWLTLNNISKIPAMIISCMIWKINMNGLEVVGLSISLIGGYLYAMDRQGLLSGKRTDVDD
jgi:GDP-mannose transporter